MKTPILNKEQRRSTLNILRPFLVLALILLSSGNSTAQWEIVHGRFIYCFALGPDGNGGNNLFAGTSGGGVLLSTDNGTTWRSVNHGLPVATGGAIENVRSLVVSPDGAGGTNILAGTDKGFYFSTNTGDSWESRNVGMLDLYVFALAVISDGGGGSTIFAGTTSGGVFRSTDNGGSWTQVNSGLSPKSISALASTPNGTGSTNLYAQTRGGSVFLSTNSGSSWTPVSTGLTFFSSFAVIGTDLFAGGQGVLLSTDYGTTWTSVSNGLTSTGVMALAVTGPYLFAGTQNGGICVTSDRGSNWWPVNGGLTNDYVCSLAINPAAGGSGAYLFAGGNGIWRRPLSQMTPPTGQNVPLAVSATVVSALAFVANWSPAIGASYYLLDVAKDSNFISYADGFKNRSVGNVTSYAVRNENGIFYLGLAPNTTYHYRLRAVSEEGVTSGNSNVIRVATKDTAMFDIFPFSKDVVKKYVYRYEEGSGGFGVGSDWEVDSGTVAYVVRDSVRSGDTATVWTIEQTEQLLHHKWSTVQAHKFDTTYFLDTTVFVTLHEDLRGLHEIDCDARVWALKHWGYGDHMYRLWIDTARNTYASDFADINERIYFDRTRGLYSREYLLNHSSNSFHYLKINATLLDPFTGVPSMDSKGRAMEFSLFQNYPNPFNPTTVIRYQLPAPSGVEGSGVGGVRLVVYDILGGSWRCW